VSGVDTVRGIAFQQAQAILTALDVLDDADLSSMRVEGIDDIVDIEVFGIDGTLRIAKQAKVRSEGYTWGKAELVRVLRRWAALPAALGASFEFVTDGRLGTTGQEVADALEAAGSGYTEGLAAILGEQSGSPVCAALSSARVRLDPSSVEALLGQAGRQVQALLPDPRTAADVREEAEEAVNRLFRAMFVQAGDSDPQNRLFTREDLAEILRVSADQSASQRWPGTLRGQFIEAARSRTLESFAPALVHQSAPSTPLILQSDSEGSGATQPISALLQNDGPSILAGRTGMGKSTAGNLLRRDAAIDDRVVLLAHAEAYLPGRLTALAAGAISEMIGEDLPAASGRQALGDRSVTLLIDGVSEVPEEVRRGLEEELRAPVAAGRGARIVLLGRDLAVLRATLPSSRPPVAYQLVDFLDQRRRIDLACRLLTGSSAGEAANDVRLQEVEAEVARVDMALGDAARNPLLLTMALSLISQGIPFTDRVGLYKESVALMAERSGAAGIAEASATLGVLYAGLLDHGRRYADPIEWVRLLADATATLGVAGVHADPRSVDDTVRRCGLVTSLGWVQTRVPIHDSFADYLAAAAHAARLATLPERLHSGDEQRVLFAAEIGGVDAAMAAQVARDLPFATVRLAIHDRRSLAEDSPTETERILRHLDAAHGYGVGLWRTADGRVVALLRPDEVSSWLDEPAAYDLMQRVPSAIIEDPRPLKVAVRIWRLSLVMQLKPPEAVTVPQPISQDQACALLAEHAAKTAKSVQDLIAFVSPPGHRDELASQIGPLGLRAVIHAQEQQFGTVTWPVSYLNAETTTVEKVSDGNDSAHTRRADESWGLTSFDELTRRSPSAEAVRRVRAALEELTVPGWLTP
jgi:hypothetical protein